MLIQQDAAVNSTPIFDPECSLESMLRMVIMRLSRRLRSERSDDTIGLSGLSALETLCRNGPLSPTALADYERIQPPSMTRIIAGLEDRNLAVREAHPTDRRQSVIAVSEAGRALVEEDRHRRQAWLSGVVDTLTEQERSELRATVPILARLIDL